MSTIQRARGTTFGIAAALAIALLAPVAARAQDQLEQAPEQTIAAAPAGPSWDETSGYGAVESSRAAIAPAALTGGAASGPTGHEVSAAIDTSWDVASGYGDVEAGRAGTARLK